MDTFATLLVPVIAAIVGAVGILTRDLYDSKSEVGRRKHAMDVATHQVNFTAEWWKAKQALGTDADDEEARARAESWLEEARTLVTDTLQPDPRPQSGRTLVTRILLTYPFHRWTAKVLRVVYFGLLTLLVTSALVSAIPPDEGFDFGAQLATSVVGVAIYGLLALGMRAWAVSIEERAAKNLLSATRSEPKETPSKPPAGWYSDPSGDPGQRYWDGHQWTATAAG